MRLSTDHEDNVIVIDANDEYSLRAALKIMRAKKGLRPSTIEYLTGINHPTYYNFDRGKQKSLQLRALVQILDLLGYDLVIKKRK